METEAKKLKSFAELITAADNLGQLFFKILKWILPGILCALARLIGANATDQSTEPQTIYSCVVADENEDSLYRKYEIHATDSDPGEKTFKVEVYPFIRIIDPDMELSLVLLMNNVFDSETYLSGNEGCCTLLTPIDFEEIKDAVSMNVGKGLFTECDVIMVCTQTRNNIETEKQYMLLNDTQVMSLEQSPYWEFQSYTQTLDLNLWPENKELIISQIKEAWNCACMQQME